MMDRKPYFFERGFRYSGRASVLGTEFDGSPSTTPADAIAQELKFVGFEQVSVQPDPLDSRGILWQGEWWQSDGLYQLGMVSAIGNDGPAASPAPAWPSGWPAILRPPSVDVSPPAAAPPNASSDPATFLDWTPGSQTPEPSRAGSAGSVAGLVVLAVGLLLLGRFLR